MDPMLGAAGAVTAVVGALVAAGAAVRARGGRRPSGRAATPTDRKVVALLIALGHDPSQVLVQVVREGKKSSKTGLRVLTRDHQPLRYYRASEIKRKQKDGAFLAAYVKARVELL